jgi:hypothetical protein
MTGHLKDGALAAAVAGLEPAAADAAHLAACAACRHQLEGLRGLIRERADSLAREAPDWQRQRREVLARLPERAAPTRAARRLRLRPLLAAAAVVLTAVGLSTLWQRAPATGPGFDGELAVEEILAEVELVLDDDRLPGFEAIDPGLAHPEILMADGAS